MRLFLSQAAPSPKPASWAIVAALSAVTGRLWSEQGSAHYKRMGGELYACKRENSKLWRCPTFLQL